MLAWLERQGKETNWKPSKEEMDALYGLAYITNEMNDKTDEVITKLYQDLKREFFNNANYENMFPLNPVDAPIKDEKLNEQKSALNEEDRKMIRIIEDAICTNEAQQLVRTKYGLELTDLADWLEKQDKQPLVLYKIATILSQYEDKDGSPLEQIRAIMIDNCICIMIEGSLKESQKTK